MHGSRFLRFIISGGLNTAVTYGIYLGLLQIIPYHTSYTIAYVSGIAFSYALNRLFVFKTHQGLRSILLFPSVYVAQYGLGMLVIWLWVDKMGMNEVVAPLMAVAITIPFTYAISQLVFLGRSKGSRELR